MSQRPYEKIYSPLEMESFLKNYKDNTTYRDVLCNDGSTQSQASSRNATFTSACTNHGGKAKKQEKELEGVKAIFKNDYIWKSVQKCPKGMIGCAPETINYKKGDSLAGLSLSLSIDKKQVVSNMGNYTVRIPVENVQLLNDGGTPVSTSTAEVVPQSFIQKKQNQLANCRGFGFRLFCL